MRLSRLLLLAAALTLLCAPAVRAQTAPRDPDDTSSSEPRDEGPPDSPATVARGTTYEIPSTDADVDHVPSVFHDAQGRPVAVGWDGSVVRFEADGSLHRLRPIGVQTVAGRPLGDGDRVALLGLDGRIRIRDMGTGEVIARTSRTRRSCIDLAVDPAGSWVVLAADRSVLLFSTEDLRPVASYRVGAPILDIDVAPDGRVAVGDGEGRVHVATRGEAVVRRADGRALYAVAFSPDGDRLAVGGTDREVRILEGRTARLARRLPPNRFWITAIGWSADGTLVAAGDESCHVTVQDLSGAASTEPRRAAFSHHTECWVSDVSFAPDGELVLGCRPNFTDEEDLGPLVAYLRDAASSEGDALLEPDPADMPTDDPDLSAGPLAADRRAPAFPVRSWRVTR